MGCGEGTLIWPMVLVCRVDRGDAVPRTSLATCSLPARNFLPRLRADPPQRRLFLDSLRDQRYRLLRQRAARMVGPARDGARPPGTDQFPAEDDGGRDHAIPGRVRKAEEEKIGKEREKMERSGALRAPEFTPRALRGCPRTSLRATCRRPCRRHGRHGASASRR